MPAPPQRRSKETASLNTFPSIGTSCGYVVTEKGRQDLARAERCICEIHIRGGMVECPHCGTVYGLVREMFSQQLLRAAGGKGA